MTPRTAETLVGRLFDPVPPARFFEEMSGKIQHRHFGPGNGYRKELLGSNPAETILDAYACLSGHLKVVEASGPITTPPPEIFASRASFEQAIKDFHAQNKGVAIYSNVVSPEMARLSRALEYMAGAIVFPTVFWGPPGSISTVHRDQTDVLAVQITGSKSWRVSTVETGFPNIWKEISPGRGGLPPCTVKNPEAEPHDVIEMRESDLLYVRRGTWHEVRALDNQDAISLAFGFYQRTVRDILSAMVDFVSDRDQDLRAPLGLDTVEKTHSPLEAFPQLLCRVATYYADASNFEDAMLWKRAFFIGSLPKLDAGRAGTSVSLSDKVKLADLAICFVSRNGSSVVLSFPGDHMTAPAGCEEAFRFISETEEFHVEELPGKITDKTRVMIVNKLIEYGVLELCLEDVSQESQADTHTAFALAK